MLKTSWTSTSYRADIQQVFVQYWMKQESYIGDFTLVSSLYATHAFNYIENNRHHIGYVIQIVIFCFLLCKYVCSELP